jgi:ribonucleoside-diphosphate reductase subunit M2
MFIISLLHLSFLHLRLLLFYSHHLPSTAMSIVETPSKATANALSTMDLNTPRKESAQPTLLEKLKASADVAKPVVVEETNKEQELEEYRKRFVGDLDCEEKDEPLLQESNSRFVLFPIKYREVNLLFIVRAWLTYQIWQMYKQAQAS